MICWNVVAITGHTAAFFLRDEDLLLSGDLWRGRIRPPLNLVKVNFYIARMDHLFCVPALWYFFRSMRCFAREARRGGGGEA